MEKNRFSILWVKAHRVAVLMIGEVAYMVQGEELNEEELEWTEELESSEKEKEEWVEKLNV